MQIGEKIYKYLEEKGMSQAEFVSKTGISQSTVSDWKRKGNNPSADKIMVICDALEITPYELLTDTEGENNPRKQVDYVAVDKDSREYMLIETYHELSDNGKQRLEGYIDSLRKAEE
ncbi:MAG: helix-turn-helix transcriptional regulator [Eubacteriales bacterium]|nr:helix-turn-helix transcriptional regulator [Eubacteriales bacterium]